MKLSLALVVHDKAFYLASLIESWIFTLSGDHECEVFVICDACRDNSVEVAENTLRQHASRLSRYDVWETPDVFEIVADNEALRRSAPDSDYMVFVQDDNHQYSQGWDTLALNALAHVEQPGALAFLAGVIFNPDMSFYRVESETPHKGFFFSRLKIPVEQYPPGLYTVDFVTRPFMVSTPLLRQVGGLGGKDFDILCFDDVDLCMRLAKLGYTNLYLSLDILNTTAGQFTINGRMSQSYNHNRDIVLPRHREYVSWRDDPFAQIATLRRTKKGYILD